MHAETSAVTLDFLLVSTDKSAQQAAQAALKQVGGTIECATSASAARDFIKSHRIDGLIVDIDLKSTLEVIAEMRRSKNARAFAFVCVKNEAESAVALKGGANALLTKPLTTEAISSNVNTFRSIILSERRRYTRHEVTLPVTITSSEHTYQGIVENISQGGMAVRLPCLLPESSIVDFSFDLDIGATIEGSAQLRWADAESLTGMAFHKLPEKCKSELMDWLDGLSTASRE